MANARKRGNGQGTACKISHNNWKAIAILGYKDGDLTKPVRRTKSGFRTKSEALAYIPILKKEKQAKEKITLKEAYDKWLEGYTSVTQSTLDCYSSGFKLFTDCWYIPISNLDIDELQACIDDTDKGYRTKQNAKVCLNLVYKWAIPRGYVSDNINLAQFVKVRAGTVVSSKRSFTVEQLEKIKENIGIIPYADYIYCNCYLGFRPSAFLSLKLSDYDPVQKTFRGGIKTEAGIDRIVTISPKISPIVENIVSQSAGGEGYIFGKKGYKIPLSEYRKVFYRCMELLDFQSEEEHTYTPHCCRHTFATLMKSVTAPDKDKLSLIGHTTTEQLNYYQDVDLNDLRKITDNL